MTDAEFYDAYTAATRYDDPDSYAADYGEEAIRLWEVARLPFRALLRKAGHSRAGLARYYCIPLRTVENWLASSSGAPSLWVRLLIAEACGIIRRESRAEPDEEEK